MHKKYKEVHLSYLLIAPFVIWILSIVFTIVYIKNEHPLYLWDFGGYYEAYCNYGEMFRKKFPIYVDNLIKSIYIDDYNAIPTVLLLPFNFMFECSRTGYIASLATSYLVPVVLLTACMAYAITDKNDRDGKPKNLFSLVIFLIFVAMGHGYWAPTLRGYPDIGGLIFIACASLYFFSIQLYGKLKWNQTLIFGVLVMLPFVFRRWYAYSVVAFYLSAFIVSCHKILGADGNTTDTPQRFRRLVLNCLYAFSCSCLLVLSLQGGLIKKIATTSYRDMYDAYQTNFINQLLIIYHAFGGVLILFAAAGLIISIANEKYKKFGIFFSCNLVMAWGLFVSTQAPGAQHALPFFFWVYLLSFIFIDWIILKCKTSIYKLASGILIIAFSILSFWHVLIGDVRNPYGLLPQHLFRKLTYAGDWSAYLKMQRDIERLLAGSSEGLSVFSSNVLLSDSLLYATGSALLRGRINFVSHVDKRDKFNVRSLQSEAVLITDPVQYHLRAETQQVIGIPASMIKQGTGFGAAYEVISGPYDIAPGVRAYMYKKSRPLTIADVDDLLSRYYVSYPEWKIFYTTYDLMLATMEKVLGDRWGTINLEPDNELRITPGEHTPTKISFATGKKIGSIGLKAHISVSAAKICGPAGGDVTLDVFGDNSKLLTENITHTHYLSVHLDASDYHRLEFVVGNNGNPDCDWLFLRLTPVMLDR